MRRPVEMRRRPYNVQDLGRASSSPGQGSSGGPGGEYWRRNSADILKSPLCGKDVALQKRRELAEERFASSIQHVCYVLRSIDRDNRPTRLDSGFDTLRRLPQATQAPPLISVGGSNTSAIYPINNAAIQAATASHAATFAPVGANTDTSRSAWTGWQHPTQLTFQHAARAPPGLEIQPTNIGMPAFQGFGGLLTQTSTASNLAATGATETQAGGFTSTQDQVQSTHRPPHAMSTTNSNTNTSDDAYRAQCMWQDQQYAKIEGTFYGRDRRYRFDKTARHW